MGGWWRSRGFDEPMAIYRSAVGRCNWLQPACDGLNWHVAWSGDGCWLAASHDADDAGDLAVSVYAADDADAPVAVLSITSSAAPPFPEARITSLTWTPTAAGHTLAVGTNRGMAVLFRCHATMTGQACPAPPQQIELDADGRVLSP